MKRAIHINAILACAFLAGCTTSATPEWTNLAATTNEGSVEYDPNSIREADGNVVLKVRGALTPQALENRQRTAAGLPLIVGIYGLLEFDCKSQKSRFTSLNDVTADGGQFHEADKTWELVLPDEPSAKVMTFACLPAWRRTLAKLTG